MATWLDQKMPKYLAKYYFSVWEYVWKKLLFDFVDSVQCFALPNSLRAWIEQKGRGRKNLVLAAWLLELGHENFPALALLVYWHLNLDWKLHHQLPGSQAFGLGLNYTTGFLASPACRWQIMELLSLHNHVSQFLIII